MKNILIALDYDPSAQKVAEMGFATGANADVTLLHVIANPSYYGAPAYDPIMGFGGYGNVDLLGPDIIMDLKNKSLDFLEKTKQHLGQENIKLVVNEGSIAETILDTAEELHCDMIVIGSHSRRWLENILMGSIAAYVLQHTVLPLYIIPIKKPN